ncbi:MAG: hypothetical protein QXX08_04120 [Candidatus Bathyarchaeia archaeon]
MKERLYPYVIFLPKDRKQRVLSAIFGSEAPIDILRFALRQGISRKIHQKDLIETLRYSNKTIIERLKTLVELGILQEEMEKAESSGRTVWLKSYVLSDLGKWFALLLVEEESLTNDQKIEIVRNAFRSYAIWVRELSGKLGMSREDLSKIFEDAMK